MDPGSSFVLCAFLLPPEEECWAWLGTKTHQEVWQPSSSRHHRGQVGWGESVAGDTGFACQGTADLIPDISAASSSSCHQLGALGRKANQESSSPGAHASLDKSHLADGDSGGQALLGDTRPRPHGAGPALALCSSQMGAARQKHTEIHPSRGIQQLLRS